MIPHQSHVIAASFIVLLLVLFATSATLRYRDVTPDLDIVQTSVASLTSIMLDAKDVIVVSDGIDGLMGTTSAYSRASNHLGGVDSPLVVSEGEAIVTRAQHVAIYCIDHRPRSTEGQEGHTHALVTITHPIGTTSVVIVLRPASSGGGVIILPPQWRYVLTACTAGCGVRSQASHSVVSRVVSAVQAH